MGLGGYLTWTAVIRELSIKHADQNIKFLPCEATGNTITKIVRSEVFNNNPHIFHEDPNNLQDQKIMMVPLNSQKTNYCLQDLPDRALHRYDKHIIHQICEYYGIQDANLKCDLYFTDQEEEEVNKLTEALPDNFVVIEPTSKINYTVNRVYPFNKWQKIVDEISKKIQVVQIGTSGSRILDGVINLTGRTTFRTATLLIKKSKCLISSEGGLTHAATAVMIPAVVVITGYQSPTMVAYPQNININISTHGPCGMKIECPLCVKDSNNHDYNEIIKNTLKIL